MTYVDLLGTAAEGGIVLLDEVPTNLILGDVGGRVVGLGGCGRVGGGVAGSGVATLLYRTIAVLGNEGAVDSGFGSHFEETKKRTGASELWRVDTISGETTVSAAGSKIKSPERSNGGVRDRCFVVWESLTSKVR